MLNWIKKHWILSIFLLFGVTPASLNYSGFCWEKKRWLSDEEFFMNAIFQGGSRGGAFAVNSMESARKFLKENPECCIFEEWGVDPFTKVFGIVFTNVNIQYELSEDARDGNDDYGEGYLWLNSCGKVVESMGTTYEKRYTRFRTINDIK